MTIKAFCGIQREATQKCNLFIYLFIFPKGSQCSFLFHIISGMRLSIVMDFFYSHLSHEKNWDSNTDQPCKVNIRLERIIHFVLLKWTSWEFFGLFRWLVSHLGDSWETVGTQVPRCCGCFGSKQKGKRLLMIFVEVTFALSVGEYIWLFVLFRDKSPFLYFFLSFFQKI